MWIHSPVHNYIHLSHTILRYPYPGNANVIYNRGHLHSRGGRGRRVCHRFVVLGKALLFSADALVVLGIVELSLVPLALLCLGSLSGILRVKQGPHALGSGRQDQLAV
ncbi:hypothetical protein [European catfish virus]|uniref:Transmembrane protein n=1 Tax=European catfish virus TaxID=84739 RepID=I2BFN2_9VIRU|nr:hypothetical protein A190_gp052 [European catfish virus]AFJ52335.1 hypothetical protein [European catfish virus]AMZ04881.1 hypothetical protein [European catfish virus]AMZ05017.1 hypothetical protein [European catfish virus]